VSSYPQGFVPTFGALRKRVMEAVKEEDEREGFRVRPLSFADLARLITVKETADRMGISERSVRRLVQAKKIRHVRMGRMLRLYVCDVDDYVSRSIVSPLEAEVIYKETGPY
jgi:excisionase family DNA binding protein